jgi:hypothetical protein
VKPDRPEAPAEARLIGKEFGDFLNQKVKGMSGEALFYSEFSFVESFL